MKIKNWTPLENRLITKLVREGARVRDIAQELEKDYFCVYSALKTRGLKRIKGVWK